MRKSIIVPEKAAISDLSNVWLDLEAVASVEVSSEDPKHPIEGALGLINSGEWRAGGKGEQTIRLRFDAPQSLRRIELIFEEAAVERNLEFTLTWAEGDQGPRREIVRQQYGFSPSGAVREREDYEVDLKGVRLLELKIIPDRSGGTARASLTSLRLA